MRIEIYDNNHRRLAESLDVGYEFTVLQRQITERLAEFEIVGGNCTRLTWPIAAGTEVTIESADNLPLVVKVKPGDQSDLWDYSYCTGLGVWFIPFGDPGKAEVALVPTELRDNTGECQVLTGVEWASATQGETSPKWQRWTGELKE